MDFSPISGQDLGFSEASIQGDVRCVNIAILDDSVQEDTEMFILRIDVEYTLSLFNFMSQTLAFDFISIIDNDGT